MKKYIFLVFLLLIFTFVGYISDQITLKNLFISDTSYSLNRKGMHNPKKPIPPLFHLKREQVFFIHPASTSDAKATFTFNIREKLLWDFSIQKGSKVGKILFMIKKNDADLKKFIVDSKKSYTINIKVKKGDKVTIIANAAGSTAGDWGNLKIYTYEKYYYWKILSIALLWVLFFTYFINKGYIYIASSSLLGFSLTLFAEYVTFGSMAFYNLSIYTIFFFLFAFLFLLIYQELKILKKLKIATILKLLTSLILFSIPTTFILFYFIFDKPIDWNILYAIYQTNYDEALGFIESFVSIGYLVGFLLFILLFGYIFWNQEKKERIFVERSLLIFIIILLIGISSRELLDARLPNFIYKTYLNYYKQIERLLEFQKKRKASIIKYSASKKEKGELYVIVIGESLNKNNMSIYGHFRNTTPRQLKQVKKDNLQVFNNVYSNAGNTMQSLSYALTETNQYNGKNFLESLSFIDIFNKAGFDTYWLTTQGILGESNTVLSVIAQSSNHIIDLGNNINVSSGLSSYYDENTIKELKKHISTSKNTLIIIHIFGSHFHYQSRYPKSFVKYKSTLPYILGTNRKLTLEDYSAYDNGVYYNDYVISNLLNIVKNKGGVSGFIYFSDHGEDIARHNGHTSRLNSFTYGMVNIPLTAWFSPEYIKRYPERYKTFTSNKEKLFSNDMIYDTVIGLAHIKTDHYGSKYDLSAKDYHLDPNKALTLHGNLSYCSPKNYYYWKKYNTEILKDRNLNNKIVITNTDTVGKLNEAWKLGFRSFSLNINYISNKSIFQCGRKKFNTKGNLIDLFAFFNVKKIQNLFLNLTNITPSNQRNILKRLEEIDKKLNIKAQTILIINSLDFAKYFKNKGWKIALNHPSSLNNLKENNTLNYLILDKKSYKKENVKNSIIITNCFNLADNKLNYKIPEIIQYNSDNTIKFLFFDFKSVFDK